MPRGRRRYSIKEIAFDLGFASSEHFTRSFKERFCTTPSEARRGNGIAVMPSSADLFEHFRHYASC